MGFSWNGDRNPRPVPRCAACEDLEPLDCWIEARSAWRFTYACRTCGAFFHRSAAETPAADQVAIWEKKRPRSGSWRQFATLPTVEAALQVLDRERGPWL